MHSQCFYLQTGHFLKAVVDMLAKMLRNFSKKNNFYLQPLSLSVLNKDGLNVVDVRSFDAVDFRGSTQFCAVITLAMIPHIGSHHCQATENRIVVHEMTLIDFQRYHVSSTIGASASPCLVV